MRNSASERARWRLRARIFSRHFHLVSIRNIFRHVTANKTLILMTFCPLRPQRAGPSIQPTQQGAF